jgi:threonine dehydratase
MTNLEQIPDRPAYEVTAEHVRAAAELLAPYSLETPLLASEPLGRIAGRPVWLKLECGQRTGSFKVRGALVRLSTIPRADRARGVVAASAGNHGLGVAWACRQLGIPGLVVLPEGAPEVKRSALAGLTVKVRLHGSGYDEAEAHARALAVEADATFVSPYDDPWVMAGNGGSVGLEIGRQLPDVSAVMAPLGGGGLAVGLAIALPGAVVIGVQSEASPAMARSLAEGKAHTRFAAAPTIAEGLEGGVSPSAVALCRRHVAGVEVVGEDTLRAAIRLLAREHRLVVEGSGAAAVAALLERKPVAGAGAICVVLSGRNIDRDRLREILTES